MSVPPRLVPSLCSTALGFAALCTPNFATAQIEARQIAAEALVEPAQTVACTLTDGSDAQCLEVTVKYVPDTLEVGPFCPATLDDVGGIWDWDGEAAGLYRIDGDFLRMLSDLGYTFYDDAGEVAVFDIRTEGPTSDHDCINASYDTSVEMTMLIPMTPVMADSATDLGTVAKVGLSLNGVPIFADAPSVLDRNHMPALDVCAGHVDPGGWYHYHGTATDMETVYGAADMQLSCANAIQDAKAQFGYAFDGHAIMGSLEADGSVPRGLDDCGGHMHGDTYHYHASAEFPNLPTCLVGEQAVDNFSTTAAQGIGSARGDTGPPSEGRPDFSAIAQRLGVEESALANAIEAAGGRDADLGAVAATLGVDENALRAALPGPDR
ncbi:YHYH protein [Octadecabacter sp. G9-8]|uniref:YHYH protein n=1 Tax=Octadecabacter dasysiphoniae TaxID=2909341 RepID=A0ABS9CTX1_9RHOB|nr:YHYH protein [Octadecabacter dasysiphoniae]MCF2869656.1 YHYH protein [Octadecabacter dasysiphoniae]